MPHVPLLPHSLSRVQATKTLKRPNGARLGRRQFAKALCRCVKKRKASQCDCQLCTYVEDNSRRWHKARSGWHSAKRLRIGGKPCACHIHGALETSALEGAWLEAGAAAAEPSAALEASAEERTWLEAGAAAAEPSAAHAEQWAAAVAARQRVERYDGMAASPEKLAAALLPCGKQSYPDYSVTGTRFWSEYDQPCAAGNCPKQLFARREACGWQHVFGADCPIECSGEAFEWYVWQMQQRGIDADGKPTYSPEWTPHRGTRAEFLTEFRAKVGQWLYHSWRDRVLRHSLRVFDDRRSGRYAASLRERVTGPTLRADALQVIAECAEVRRVEAVNDASLTAAARMTALRAARAGTLAAVARTAHAAAASHRLSERDKARLLKAEAQLEALSNTAVVQCDYAAQFESERARNATCARMERHNFEVCHVGFAPYKAWAREGRFRGKRPRLRASPDYKQHVYVFFAFFNAGYKPNARSHNVVQDDIDHFLKYGTFLYGEWFEGGARCPGGPTGDARPPLPDSLSEAPLAPPVLPGYNRRLEVTDGCGTQYDGGSQHHQTAEWRTKTASWPEAQQTAAAAAEEMTSAKSEAEAAAAAARKAAAELGIVRVHVKKVESHGKAGATDGEGNVPTFALKAAIESGALLHPGTRELVLFLADHRRAPSVAKEAKDGWQAATKYFWGYIDTAQVLQARCARLRGARLGLPRSARVRGPLR